MFLVLIGARLDEELARRVRPHLAHLCQPAGSNLTGAWSYAQAETLAASVDGLVVLDPVERPTLQMYMQDATVVVNSSRAKACAMRE